MIFIEDITVFSWLLDVLPFLMKRSFRPSFPKPSIYYIDATRLGLGLARLTCRWLNYPFEKLDFRLVDIRDDDGNLLRLRIEYQDLAQVQQAIWKNPIFQTIIHNAAKQKSSLNERLEFFLKKRCVDFTWYNADTIWRMLLLVHVVVWRMKTLPSDNRELVLMAVKRFWTKEIKDYASSYGVKVVFMKQSRWHLKETLLRCLGKNRLRSWYYLFLKISALRKTPFDFRQKRRWCKETAAAHPQESASSTRFPARLMVEYYGHLNLNEPQYYSDLFFWQKSLLSGKDIVVTFNIPADPLNETILQNLKEHGMTAVLLNPRATNVPHVPLFQHRNGNKKNLGFSEALRGASRDFMSRMIQEYYEDYGYWVDLFSKTQTKIHISWYKYDSQHSVIADAMQTVGGVAAIYQRAFEEFPSPGTTIATDIVFGFSKQSAMVEQQGGSVIPYYIITGYSPDYRFVLLRQFSQKIKKQLREQGAKRIIAYFDEGSGADSRWHTGHEIMRENYAFLLQKLLSQPDLGLIFKPKIAATLRARLGPVKDLLEQAEQTGRCYVFSGGALHNRYPPSIAALAADVAIHGHLCAATAGLESALAGIPTLLLDREGWPVSSLYQLGKGKVVFSDWDHLWETCQEYWRMKGIFPGFGDWTSILDDLDPFRDGRAAQRIGTYLHDLLAGFQRGEDRQTVMSHAAQRYAEVWGQDKIIKISPTIPPTSPISNPLRKVTV
jgi:hypothetical protein